MQSDADCSAIAKPGGFMTEKTMRSKFALAVIVLWGIVQEINLMTGSPRVLEKSVREGAKMWAIFDMKPHEKQYALLEGEDMKSYVPENNRVYWNLSFHKSEKTLRTTVKKRKRMYPYNIFIMWTFTLEDVIKNGTLLFERPSEKILLSDKLDIMKQLFKED